MQLCVGCRGALLHSLDVAFVIVCKTAVRARGKREVILVKCAGKLSFKLRT